MGKRTLLTMIGTLCAGVFAACGGEPAGEQMVEYGLAYTAPPGQTLRAISIVRIGADLEPVQLPGCTAHNPVSEFGELRSHSCQVLLPPDMPGEFNVRLTTIVPGEPGFDPWELEQSYTDMTYGRFEDPPYGQLEIWRNGHYARSVFIDGAPSWAEKLQHGPEAIPSNLWDTASPCPQRFPYRDSRSTCSFLSPEQICGSIPLSWISERREQVQGYPVFEPLSAPPDPVPVKPGETLLLAAHLSSQSGPACEPTTVEEISIGFKHHTGVRASPEKLEIELRSGEYTVGRIEGFTRCGEGVPCSAWYDWLGELDLPFYAPAQVAVVCTNCERVVPGETLTTTFQGEYLAYRVGPARYWMSFASIAATVKVP